MAQGEEDRPISTSVPRGLTDLKMGVPDDLPLSDPASPSGRAQIGVTLRAEPGTFRLGPPIDGGESADKLQAEGTVLAPLKVEAHAVTGPVAIGRTVLANRDAIVIQSTAIQLLLAAAIDRARLARSNSTSVPELEAILSAIQELHQVLLATAAPADVRVGIKATSIRRALANWWDRDHVSILDRGFNMVDRGLSMGLFAAGLMLCSQFGLLPALTVATVLRGNDVANALEKAAKLLRPDEEDD